MDRRTFIKGAALATAGAAAGPAAWGGNVVFNPRPGPGWRVFEVVTRITPEGGQPARAWVPLPSVDEPLWSRPMGNVWQGNAVGMTPWRDPVYGAQLLVAEWDANEPEPVLEVVSRFATRDRAVDLAGSPGGASLDAASRALYTRATDLLPTDGIVRDSALRITRGATTDQAKARAIYEWIVDNTERNPKVRGCGVGDIRFMLESGDLTGKCADLNALYVGLARAAGLPARDVYGVRVADSRFGYKSLGKSGDVTRAQHCRAEVWLDGPGWVPVDPADVRKVVLEEKPGLTLADEVVVAARKTLFGAWETNWLPYNVAHDLVLPGSATKVPFLMYPQGERGGRRLDSLDPARFAYTLTSRELASA